MSPLVKRSNRTFMELKSWFAAGIAVLVKAGSNRTFMELKYSLKRFGQMGDECSNRTFMELKLP